MSERARSDVLGQPVLSIKEGLLLGRIRQILFDSTVNQVHGFIVERFRGGKDDRILPFSAISSFGEDGIMVESQTLLERRGTSHQYTRSLRHPLPIIGARVFTASGRTLGKVEEYLFSTQDGSITGLEISGGLFRGKMLAPGKYIIAISPQTIMMKDAAIDEAIEVDTSLRFHVSEGLDAMKERATNFKNNAADATKNLSANISEAMGLRKHQPDAETEDTIQELAQICESSSPADSAQAETCALEKSTAMPNPPAEQ